MKISQKSPKKSAPAAGLLGRGAAPQTPLTGGTPRESTPVAPGGPSTPQGCGLTGMLCQRAIAGPGLVMS